jgi:predicted dithiol-disulfide oxidoreductase (DUF899 family)
MTLPQIVSRDQWSAARKALLTQEEEAAAAWERLAEARRNLPMVEIDKRYEFDTTAGRKNLLDLFEGRRQLIVYHFMFDPEWDQGCKWCSWIADNIGHLSHLHARDTTLTLVSRAPLPKIEQYKARMEWSVPWASSFASDFNTDFYATLDGSADPEKYMFRDKETMDAKGMYYFTQGEQGGVSVFLRDGDRVFHTLSDFGFGIEALHGTLHYLDLTPLGRGSDATLRHHDRYE